MSNVPNKFWEYLVEAWCYRAIDDEFDLVPKSLRGRASTLILKVGHHRSLKRKPMLYSR